MKFWKLIVKKILVFVSIVLFFVAAYVTNPFLILNAYTDYDTAFRLENLAYDDEAVDIKLNGYDLTFREVFENNFRTPNYSLWGAFTVDNGVYSLIGDGSSNNLRLGLNNNSYNSNEYLYVRYDFKYFVDTGYTIGGGYLYDYSITNRFLPWIIDLDFFPNVFNSYSGIVETIYPYDTYIRLLQLNLSYSNLGIELLMKNLYLVNLSNFGLEHLTFQEMDNYFTIYQYLSKQENNYTEGQYYTTGTRTYYFSPHDYVVIDLTQTFGNGNIPSIEVFEQEYMTQAPTYFDVFENYTDNDMPLENLNDFDTNVLIDDLDYDTSVLGFYGSNLDFDIWGVFEDPDAQLTLPKLFVNYLGKQYEHVATKEGNKFRFILNAQEKDRIKRILFDRRDTDFITFEFAPSPYSYPNVAEFYFQIETNFRLNATINTIFLGTYQNHIRDTVARNWDTPYDLRNHKTEFSGGYLAFTDFRFFDNQGLRQTRSRVMFPVQNDETTNPNDSYLIQFPQKYTNVKSFLLSFYPVSTYDSMGFLPFYMQFYEIGIFSDTDIVNPSYSIDITPGDYFQPEYETVKWYDFFGHTKNAFNYLIYDNSVSHFIQDIIVQITIFATIFKTSLDLVSGVAIIGVIFGLSIVVFLTKKSIGGG